MSRRLKIGCGVMVVLIALAVAVPLKLLRGRPVEVDVDTAKRADIEETVVAVPVGGQPAAIVKPDDVKVIPKVGGEVKSLLVEEGDYVRAGQVLAFLDPKELDADLHQAEQAAIAARARAAQAAADLRAVPVRTQTAVDEARAAVDQAAATYRTTLRGARKEEIERARQAVVQADKDLEDAEATLATVQRGARPEEIAAAEAAVRQAEASADVAKAQLDLVRAGPRPEEVAEAQAAVDEAESQVALRQKELESQRKLAEGGFVSGNALRSAQTAYDTAVASRNSAKERLALARQPYRPEDITKAEASYRQAVAQAEQSRHNRDLTRTKTTPEDLAGARARRDAATARLKSAQADLQLAEHRTTKEDLDSAAAAVRSQKAGVRRAEADRVSVPQRQLDVVALEADARRAEAALQQTAERAGYTTVIAPISGMVTQLNRKQGEYVQGGQMPLPSAEMAMLIITNTERVWIEANIDEADVGKVKPGQAATITLRGGGKVQARVHTISPSIRLVQNDVRTFAVKLAVDKPTPELRSGMSVDVDIVVRANRNCLSVLGYAIFEDKQGKEFVYLIKGGKAVKQEIKKGIEGIERVEVTSGVKDGDRIITSLEEKGLRDNAKVKIRTPKEGAPKTETGTKSSPEPQKAGGEQKEQEARPAVRVKVGHASD